MESAQKTTPEAGRLYRFAWGFYLILALVAVLWIGFERGLIPLALFIDRKRWWLDVGLGLGAGLGLLALWAGASRWLPAARSLEARLAQHLGPISTAEALGLAVLSAFAEELFFRGAVQGACGAITATLLFGLLHSGRGADFRLWTLFACLAGALFSLLLHWRGNLFAPFLGHFLVNATNLRRLGRRADMFGRLTDDGTETPKET